MSRDRLIEIVEEGTLDPMMALQMCARWMTDDECHNMLDAHELTDRFLEDEEETDYSNREPFTRHGGAYDRGAADACYQRPCAPHYYTGDTYQSTRIEQPDMSEEEVMAYMQGFQDVHDSGEFK